MDRAQMLSQKVEKEVRQLIGDLHMQNIVMRCMMEMQGGEQQPQPAEPKPAPPHQPEPKEPEPKEPEKEPPMSARPNGKGHPVRGEAR